MKDKVEKWFLTLKASNTFPLKSEEIKQLWGPVAADLSDEEQLALLIRLTEKDYVFKWLYLISELVPLLFSDSSKFLFLVKAVVEKIKNDLAQGVFIRSLIITGERKPDLTIQVYPKLIEASDDLTIEYIGLMLGGAAKKEFSDAFKLIEKGLKDPKIPTKVASLKALRVAFESEGLEFPKTVFDILDDLRKVQDSSLQSEVINAYLDFDKYDSERAEKILTEISASGDQNAHYTITRRLSYVDLANKEREIEILENCANDKNPIIQQNLFQTFARKGAPFLKESLNIIRKMLKSSGYHSNSISDYYFQETCKGNEEVCIRTMESWIEQEKADTEFTFDTIQLLTTIKK